MSVLLPVYNDERFVRRAIESILDQTFRDFELLVVDDGSTDGTAAALDSVHDGRVRVFHQRNAGVPVSLNRMIAASTGKYVARMDSDDTSASRRLERQVQFLESHPEIGLVGSACEIVDEAGKHLARFGVPTNDRAVRRAMRWVNPIVHSSVMVRRTVLEEAGRYDPALRMLGAEDYDLWWRILRISRISNLDEVLVRRVHREASIFRVAKSRHHAAMVRLKWRAMTRGSAPKSVLPGIVLNGAKWCAHKSYEVARSMLGAIKARPVRRVSPNG